MTQIHQNSIITIQKSKYDQHKNEKVTSFHMKAIHVFNNCSRVWQVHHLLE